MELGQLIVDNWQWTMDNECEQSEYWTDMADWTRLVRYAVFAPNGVAASRY